jgi:hypothetical protein
MEIHRYLLHDPINNKTPALQKDWRSKPVDPGIYVDYTIDAPLFLFRL